MTGRGQIAASTVESYVLLEGNARILCGCLLAVESKTFRLPFDSSKKAYGLVDIHVRLLKPGPPPSACSLQALLSGHAPAAAVEIELSMAGGQTVGLARTTLNEGLPRNSSFAETIKQPVEVVASLALANPNPNLPDLEFRQLLRVQIETSTSMGWSVDNNLLLRPGPGLEMIADGHNHFTLQAWISRYEPAPGTSVDVSEEYEFEHPRNTPSGQGFEHGKSPIPNGPAEHSAKPAGARSKRSPPANSPIRPRPRPRSRGSRPGS